MGFHEEHIAGAEREARNIRVRNVCRASTEQLEGEGSVREVAHAGLVEAVAHFTHRDAGVGATSCDGLVDGDACAHRDVICRDARQPGMTSCSGRTVVHDSGIGFDREVAIAVG